MTRTPNPDARKPGTFDKVASVFFPAVTKRSFTFAGKTYEPRPELVVSPLVFRDYTCPVGCGACCVNLTLDWLPSEPRPDSPHVRERVVKVDGREFQIFSDLQLDNQTKRCRNLNLEDGRCNIHPVKPMHCDLELTKFIHHVSKTILMTKLYGRGWALTKIDGVRGAMCEMLPPDEHSVAEVVRKLERLRDWCVYFGMDTWCDDLVAWARSYPQASHEPLRLALGEKIFS